jgi:uncharacterized protein (UPF0335 family)
MAEGHNGQLQSIIERIERLEDEKAKISLDIREIYAEAKSNGFDAKILRKIVAIRKQDADKRDEEQQLIATYMAALGMLADTPLGQVAIARNVRT